MLFVCEGSELTVGNVEDVNAALGFAEDVLDGDRLGKAVGFVAGPSVSLSLCLLTVGLVV